jgi:hypothetical protein
MGIRDKPITPASPWQNGFAERLIGSIRRECLDHLIVFGEEHLRHILKSYADYYNCVRTHRSLHKDAPVSRPVQRSGIISSHVILGGLHHQYVRDSWYIQEAMSLDLASLASVRAFAAELTKRLSTGTTPPLHAVVCNAGSAAPVIRRIPNKPSRDQTYAAVLVLVQHRPSARVNHVDIAPIDDRDDNRIEVETLLGQDVFVALG